jgi:hypothetical protein
MSMSLFICAVFLFVPIYVLYWKSRCITDDSLVDQTSSDDEHPEIDWHVLWVGRWMLSFQAHRWNFEWFDDLRECTSVFVREVTDMRNHFAHSLGSSVQLWRCSVRTEQTFACLHWLTRVRTMHGFFVWNTAVQHEKVIGMIISYVETCST